MTSTFVIDVYSHHIAVTGFTRQGKDALLDFCATRVGQKETVFIGNGQYTSKLTKLYAAATKNRKEFRFHRNQLSDILDFLKQRFHELSDIDVRRHFFEDPFKVAFTLNPKYILRDYQEPVVNYLTTEEPAKIVVLQPGAGKTLSACAAIARLGMRTAIIIPGKYVDKWLGDCKELLGLKAGEVLAVRGSRDLKRLIDLGVTGELQAKVLIITSTTVYNFIKDYELHSGMSDEYGCKPQDFFKVLGVGVRLIDEVHQNFHLNFRIDLYSHTRTSIDLSATIDVDDTFISRMYKLKYPLTMRYNQGTYNRYIAATALLYKLYDGRMIRTSHRGQKQYSHTAFELSVMKSKKSIANYLELLKSVVQSKYLAIRKPTQKLLVFASTKEMCRIMAESIRTYAPGLSVGTYIAEDDYEKLLQNDISVSTPISAGTAVDIPGLRVTIATVAIGSRQLNEQMLGRLRQLKDFPDETPDFFYFCCEDIPKHMEYHDRKMETFKGKVISHKVAYLRGGL